MPVEEVQDAACSQQPAMPDGFVLRPEEVTRARACVRVYVVCVWTPYGIFPLRRLILIPTLCSRNWSFPIASCSPCWPLAFLLKVPLAPFDAFPIIHTTYVRSIYYSSGQPSFLDPQKEVEPGLRPAACLLLRSTEVVHP